MKSLSTICSAVIGFFGAVGFVCAFNLMVIGAFDSFSQYPIRFPVCMIGGIVSLIICITATVFYFYDLIKNKAYRMLPLHFVCVIAFFVFGYFISALVLR